MNNKSEFDAYYVSFEVNTIDVVCVLVLFLTRMPWFLLLFLMSILTAVFLLTVLLHTLFRACKDTVGDITDIRRSLSQEKLC